jgi:hypothetical protein
VLEQFKESRPLPRQIRVDNVPELISAKLIAWCDNHQIRLHKSLGNLPPSLYRQQLNQTKSIPNSNFQMSH